MAKVEIVNNIDIVDDIIPKVKPTKKKKVAPEIKAYGHSGRLFEAKINTMNKKYQLEGRAFIFKTFPEAVIIKKNGRVTTATYKDKGVLDYVGFTKGRTGFMLEAKNCEGTSFPLSNIKEHQFETAKQIDPYISFCLFLINMNHYGKTYLVHASDIEIFRKTNTRKSIPIEWLCEYGVEVEDLDYLSVIEQYE